MMLKQIRIFALLMLLVTLNTKFADASLIRAEKLYKQGRGSVRYFPEIVRELIDDKMYFTSVPLIKEYLNSATRVSSSKIDELIDRIINGVGVKQFEVLPERLLSKSRAPTIKYILAKKYFRAGLYNGALRMLNQGIPRRHPARPFALLLKGSIYSIIKKYNDALTAFDECISASNSALSDEGRPYARRQLKINRDYCIVGIPRTEYAAGKFNRANLSYMELPKASHIWPEILFEEAWNSFFQRDYNRTLGKLVTYKNPLFLYIFNPEIEVLRALTFFELCLWNDARKVVENFYRKYQDDAREVRSFLSGHKKDYKYFYFLAKKRRSGRVRGNDLLNRLLYAIVRDATYVEMYEAFESGSREIEKLKSVRSGVFKRVLNSSLKEAMVTQRNLIGSYVRKVLYLYMGQMKKTFEGMSNIRLETLSRIKSKLYRTGSRSRNRSRGDIKYLRRSARQYFWKFNSEFWADELGDYVFSLKSECGK